MSGDEIRQGQYAAPAEPSHRDHSVGPTIARGFRMSRVVPHPSNDNEPDNTVHGRG